MAMLRLAEPKTDGYFEDFEVGGTLITKGRTISETDLVEFAALTWDNYSLHTDAEWAKETIFGERIAHGMLILSYSIGLRVSGGTIGKIIALYGIDKLRFTNPVRIGDTIHVETLVLEMEDKGKKGGLITEHMMIKNQRGEVVVDAITKGLYAKRPTNPEN